MNLLKYISTHLFVSMLIVSSSFATINKVTVGSIANKSGATVFLYERRDIGTSRLAHRLINPCSSTTFIDLDIPKITGEFLSFMQSDALILKLNDSKIYFLCRDDNGIRCYKYIGNYHDDVDAFVLIESVDFASIGIKKTYSINLIIYPLGGISFDVQLY